MKHGFKIQAQRRAAHNGPRLAALAMIAMMTVGGSAMAGDILITVAWETHRVAMEESSAAERFAARLPLTERLAVDGAPQSATPVRGTFAYYAPWGNVCAFMRPFRVSQGLVPLGRFDEAGIRAIERAAANEVTFSRVD